MVLARELSVHEDQYKTWLNFKIINFPTTSPPWLCGFCNAWAHA